MAYEDKTMVCLDCGVSFPFTAAEQESYASQGFKNDPKRCQTCREARKAQHVAAARSARNQAARSSGGEGGEGGGGGGGGRRERGGYGGGGRGGYGRGRGGFGGPRQMFPTVCAACGQQTEVPFKPTGTRPVYCRECFQSQRTAEGQ